MEETLIDINCKECDGEGSVDVLKCKMDSASNCCGGCYDSVDCEECNGRGGVTVDFDEHFYNQISDLKKEADKFKEVLRSAGFNETEVNKTIINIIK